MPVACSAAGEGAGGRAGTAAAAAAAAAGAQAGWHRHRRSPEPRKVDARRVSTQRGVEGPWRGCDQAVALTGTPGTSAIAASTDGLSAERPEMLHGLPDERATCCLLGRLLPAAFCSGETCTVIAEIRSRSQDAAAVRASSLGRRRRTAQRTHRLPCMGASCCHAPALLGPVLDALTG